MSLSKKIALYLVLLGACIGIGCFAAIRFTIFPAFERFEVESAHAEVTRVDRLLEVELAAFETLVTEYAHWNETYEFVAGRNAGFVQENLSGSYWGNIGVDLVLILDMQGDVIWGADTRSGSSLPVATDEVFTNPPVDILPLLDIRTEGATYSGLVQTRFGPMKFASAEILTTYRKGPPRGYVVVGRQLDDAFVSALGERASVSLTLHPVTVAGAVGFTASELAAMSRHGGTEIVVDRAGEIITGRRLLHAVDGQPLAVAEITTDQAITAVGARTITAAMFLVAAITAVFLIIGIVAMRRLVVQPVNRLAESMQQIRTTGDLKVSIERSRGDEIGRLVNEFDDLTTGLHLARLELETTRDLAIEASRTKSQFLARMSHEIRTPMNGVLGMTELLRNTSLDFEQRHFADTIYTSAENLLDIINDVLDFSKIEAGKMQFEIRDFNLGALVEEAAGALAPQAHNKGLELIVDIESSPHRVYKADPVRLRQVLTNLVGNAIKFTKRGEIVVRAFSTKTSDEQSTVHFEVVDTGVGIQEDKQRVIFESFSQEDGSTTRVYGGTGLGLAISGQIVELMGGSLEVSSVPGEGSCFSFDVVLPHGEAAVQQSPGRRASVAGKRILVVDDNATNREIIEIQLKSWRARCDVAEGATDALLLLERSATADDPYDLVILDMEMPRIDGLQLARAIREVAAYDDVALILLSSIAMPARDDVLDELRIAGQLAKPIRQGQLYDSLSVILSGNTLFSRGGRVAGDAVRTLSGRVLMAEDNPVNQAVAVGMLDSMGIDVAVVPDGKAAVDAVASHRFDLVLMDCQMPGMDGLEATRQIRAAEAANGDNHIPIVALTASAMAGDRERCLEAGMDDFLGKPFSMDKLHAVVSVYLLRTSECAGRREADSEEEVNPSLFDTQNLTDPPLDRSALEVLAKLQQPGAPNLVSKVVSIYLDGAEDSRDHLLAAVEREDAARLREVAHAFKSSSMNVGATRLADICKKLEQLAMTNNLADAPALARKFEREFARVVDALQGELESVTK